MSDADGGAQAAPKTAQLVSRADPERVRALAYAITKTALALVAPQLAVAQNLVDLVEIICRQSKGPRERRTIDHLLDDLVGDVADKIGEYERQLPGVDGGERTQAIEGLQAAIHEMNFDYLEFARVHHNPDYVISVLEPLCAISWRERQLSDGGVRYGEKILRAAASSFAAYVRPLPLTDRDITIRTLLLTDEAPKRFLESLRQEILPQARRGTRDEITDFDAEYLTALGRRYGFIELFGIGDLPEALRQQPLDVSYISLTTTAVASPAQLRDSAFDAAGGQPRSRLGAPQPVERTINEVGRRSRAAGHGVRMMVVGGAGSGKTTVGRWLATKCAQLVNPVGQIESEVDQWAGRFPVFLALRDIFNSSSQDAPVDEQLLESIRSHVSTPPGMWLQEMLRSGRIALVLDGLDEVPPHRRRAAADWILSLGIRYPETWIVLTSRPEALDRKWLGDGGFTLVELKPLSVDQIRDCISRWFGSLRLASPQRAAELGRQQLRLLDDVLNRPMIRELAETPLLAAILSAYYASTSSGAPFGRIDLISSVVAVLIDKRDRERGLIPPEFINFGGGRKMRVLGAIAFRMYQLGLSQVDIYRATSEQFATAIEICTDELSEMAGVGLDPQRTIEYLLERSFVFIEVSKSLEAQFAHRLFLEYLTADYIVENGHVSILESKAELPGWMTVVAFFCSRAPAYQALAFLRSLAQWVADTREDDERRRMTYCLAECAGTQAVCPEEVVAQLTALLPSCLPPETHDELVQLSGAGSLLVPLLKNPRSSEEAVTYIAAMCRIRGKESLEVLSQYSTTFSSPDVVAALVDAWDSFPAGSFAENVLANLDLRSSFLMVRTAACLESISKIGSVRLVRISNIGATPNLFALREMADIVELDLSECVNLVSLDGIENLHHLQRLWLPKSSDGHSLSCLRGHSGLRQLHIFGAGWMQDPDVLGSLAGLAFLYLDVASQESMDNSGLSRAQQLRMLAIRRSDISSLNFLSGLQSLKVLRVDSDAGLVETEIVGSFNRLERLEISLASGRRPALVLPKSQTLLKLRLSGYVSEIDLTNGLGGRISSHVNLRHFSAPQGVVGMKDLQVFRDNVSLRELEIDGTGDFLRLEGIEALARLERFVLTSTSVEWLSGAAFRLTLDDGHNVTHYERMDTSTSNWRVNAKLGYGVVRAIDATNRWSLATCVKLKYVDLSFSPQLGSVTELTEIKSLTEARLRSIGNANDRTDIDNDVWWLERRNVLVDYYPVDDGGQAVS